MQKHTKPEVEAIFNALGFTTINPLGVMTDWTPQSPAPEEQIPAIFHHAGIDAYFAYAPDIIDGMWDWKLQQLAAIAVIDDTVNAESIQSCSDLPLQLIKVKDLPEFLAQHAFNPTYFDLRIAKRCVAHAKQELNDLEGDKCPTRDQFRKCHIAVKEAVKHLRNLAVPRYQSVTRALQPSLWPVAPLAASHGSAF